ncbi:MAG: ABC transporter ATP-binding protein [Treponema sp.]|jgi:branched-chain amino acid transport system ATP-binding protein|nr:ABC transporter ATP-binding protein [Treponema sp.]
MNGEMHEPILRVQNLSIVFGGLTAVSGFSCELQDGELVGLIGPNGAGKTTVFNMLSGLYKPTAGTITFRNRDGQSFSVENKTPAALNRIGIARTFQNIRLFGNLSVEDNVRIALHSQREAHPLDVLFRSKRFYRDEERITERADGLLELFRILHKKHERTGSLPYGEQRKLEIARALAARPSLLLLDEPAAGMNPQETRELMELVSFIRKQFRLTILLIEHDMNMVMGICERLIVLDYGRTIAVGVPADIRANPAVIKAYLGSDAAAQPEKGTTC